MTLRLKGVALLFASWGFVAGGPAMASAGGAFIPAGDVADAPSGFVEMCERDDDLCFAGIEPARLRMEDGFRARDGLISAGLVSARLTAETLASDARCPLLSRLSSYLTSLEPAYAATRAGAFRIRVPDPGSAPVQGECGEVGLSTQPAAIFSAALVRPVAPSRGTHSSGLPLAGGQTADARQLVSGRPRPLSQLGDAMHLLKKVNSRVNRHVRQVSDYDTLGMDERWDRPGIGSKAVGDCEDLAIEKRMQLLEAGFAPGALFYGTVYKRGFGLHVVLIARTEQGDMVLDSLTPHVVRWDKTKYSWLRVQSTDDPTLWRRVGAPSPAPVLAAEEAGSAHGIS